MSRYDAIDPPDPICNQHEALLARVKELEEVLERVEDILIQAQGEWSWVTKLYAPLWTQPYKEAGDEIKAALAKGVK